MSKKTFTIKMSFYSVLALALAVSSLAVYSV